MKSRQKIAHVRGAKTKTQQAKPEVGKKRGAKRMSEEESVGSSTSAGSGAGVDSDRSSNCSPAINVAANEHALGHRRQSEASAATEVQSPVPTDDAGEEETNDAGEEEKAPDTDAPRAAEGGVSETNTQNPAPTTKAAEEEKEKKKKMGRCIVENCFDTLGAIDVELDQHRRCAGCIEEEKATTEEESEDVSTSAGTGADDDSDRSSSSSPTDNVAAEDGNGGLRRSSRIAENNRKVYCKCKIPEPIQKGTYQCNNYMRGTTLDEYGRCDKCREEKQGKCRRDECDEIQNFNYDVETMNGLCIECYFKPFDFEKLTPKQVQAKKKKLLKKLKVPQTRFSYKTHGTEKFYGLGIADSP